MATVATAWGKASVAEEVKLAQSANGKRFTTHVQLLEDEVARRGPVTLRGADLERLRKALAKAPRLREVLDLGGE
jgi:hypothetical protein